MELYVMMRTVGPAWVTGTPVRQQPLWDEHAEYIDRLYAAGKVVLAGPFSDGQGALVVVRVENEQEARHIFDGDPWVTENMLDSGEPRHWQIFLNAFNDK